MPQADFQRQMQWLEDQGYEAVTLDQVEAAWYEHGELPPKPIVVSFDDGYLSQYVARLPRAAAAAAGRACSTWSRRAPTCPDADVQKMLDAGWELGLAHDHPRRPDHPRLGRRWSARSPARARSCERRFGVPVDNFCYPSGRYDDTVISAVHRAGYVGAQTEIPGLANAAHPVHPQSDRDPALATALPGFVEKLQRRRGPASRALAGARAECRWLEAELPGARAAFSTRLGGVSEGPFESLNLGRLTGDRPDAVRENRHRLAAALGIDPELVLIGRQVHGAEVVRHDGPTRARGLRESGPGPAGGRRPCHRRGRTWRRSCSSPTACRWRSRGRAAWR